MNLSLSLRLGDSGRILSGDMISLIAQDTFESSMCSFLSELQLKAKSCTWRRESGGQYHICKAGFTRRHNKYPLLYVLSSEEQKLALLHFTQASPSSLVGGEVCLFCNRSASVHLIHNNMFTVQVIRLQNTSIATKLFPFLAKLLYQTVSALRKLRKQRQKKEAVIKQCFQ